MTAIDEKIAAEGRQNFVNSVFNRVAARYDLMNDLMSAGIHRLWKEAAINWLSPSPSKPSILLDIAGGTGDLAKKFLRAAGPGSKVVICDINASMIAEGRRRLGDAYRDRAAFVQGNAERLPFRDNFAEFCTIAFGIRNVPSLEAALAEAFRILRPGGRFLCLEFSRVDTPILDKLYRRYSRLVVPALGQLVAGDAEPYRYLVESIAKFPDQRRLAAMMEAAGFVRVQFRNLSGGIAAMHSGVKA
ncbi:MAG TPA: bifunctional demethylmenaquinone methyltransferase/2-methoxy-6-polyprenyl-1,4-benzoquinol methylase UbiE [Hyphomicrobiales bacterium]|nr:bifunctional demethylmenaquinone methyltransferase/2-methoxy-6-polyprenyl-1,4-benzoquinol methylase UbiE [Hyphomicrobiales bacterium]